MKPTRNQVFCLDCSRSKMLFESESKANNFIKFNKEEIESQSGFSPERSYYCSFCAGWHVTSHRVGYVGLSKKEKLLDEHIKNKDIVRTKQETVNIQQYWDGVIESISDNKKEVFINENISRLKEEIEPIVAYKNDLEKDNLKELRRNQEYLFILRKNFGFHNSQSLVVSTEKIEEMRSKELDSWKEWADKMYK